MKFSYLNSKISTLKNKSLPGIPAHQKLAPLERPVFDKYNIPKSAKKAGVLVLIFPDNNDEANILLTKRAEYKGVHSNQISFPGGKKNNEDVDLKNTALRETNEEVGLKTSNINIHKKLSPIYIPPSNFNIEAYLSTVNQQIIFHKNYEVAEVICFPIKELLNDENLTTFTTTTSYGKNIVCPCFLYKNYHIWGATAMILNEVKEVLKNM